MDAQSLQALSGKELNELQELLTQEIRRRNQAEAIKRASRKKAYPELVKAVKRIAVLIAGVTEKEVVQSADILGINFTLKQKFFPSHRNVFNGIWGDFYGDDDPSCNSATYYLYDAEEGVEYTIPSAGLSKSQKEYVEEYVSNFANDMCSDGQLAVFGKFNPLPNLERALMAARVLVRAKKGGFNQDEVLAVIKENIPEVAE